MVNINTFKIDDFGTNILVDVSVPVGQLVTTTERTRGHFPEKGVVNLVRGLAGGGAMVLGHWYGSFSRFSSERAHLSALGAPAPGDFTTGFGIQGPTPIGVSNLGCQKPSK